MSKNDQLRLRHLIPKKALPTDYEKQECLQRSKTTKTRKKDFPDNNIVSNNRKETVSKNQIEYGVMKAYKKDLKNNFIEFPKSSIKRSLDYKEDYKPSNKNLKNYYDHIYLEKKGKIKLHSIDHPWVNDD